MDEAVKLREGELRNLTPLHSNILNLSLTYSLSEAEQSLLERGLFFIPTPLTTNRQDLRRDLYRYHRRIKLLDHFDFTMDSDREMFINPSTWEPKWESVSDPVKELIERDKAEFQKMVLRNEKNSNLSSEERKALSRLKNNQDIIIKPADKGSKIVIMDKNQYLTEANRQLNNTKHYRPLAHSLQLETQEQIRRIVRELWERRAITAKQMYYLFGEDPPRPRKFYLLPKIHKNPDTWTVPHQIPSGRPIVSDCGSESYRIAEFIDYFLNPLSQTHESYVKDTYEFVEKLKSVKILPGAMLFSIDIDSLYTNIDTTLGLRAVREIFQRYPDPTRPDEVLLNLLELGLTRNDFEFNSKHYLQIHGTAMGKKFAPAYANIYMADWERTVFPKCQKLPTLYVRYLDDIFGVWNYSESDFKDFVAILNTHHETISIKYNLQTEKIEFLDTEVYIMRGENGDMQMGTRVYFKPTDTHALLHKSSYHPKHTYKGIVKSQLIRFRRICTAEEDVSWATRTLFKALRSRGYSRTFLRTIKSEVKLAFQRDNGPSRGQNNQSNIVPFVSTFSQVSVKLNKTIKVSFKMLQDTQEPWADFKIISAFRRNKNLKDVLVHASLGRERKDKLEKHYRAVSFLNNQHTNLGAPVQQTLGLRSSNLVYGIECGTCGKLYIGQTKNNLLQRLKQHLYLIDRTKKLTALYVHFRLHGSDKLLISGLESGVCWSDKQRVVRERHWIKTLKTVFPNGLNEI